ncbi:chemokine (C-C motif) ligand 34b, duplicate 9 [Chelmon rostratus]|uniref:chemokine (C-C motif) ligand 34b, duplicate 9 n=1 Tax=Chelmon rostratus TaxID=109905 RepID=UPI001BE92554|nr:chemokine (C-C motif) ligand 34b, duplicate 9 [Chelmon rostratus]
MHFSISCGLSFMCANMLLFLPAQGQLQRATPEPPNQLPVAPPCCMEVSQAHIREPVSACFEQMEGTFPNCKIHAYIFVTVSQELCVDPKASWLPERLRKLQERGIFCKIL